MAFYSHPKTALHTIFVFTALLCASLATAAEELPEVSSDACAAHWDIQPLPLGTLYEMRVLPKTTIKKGTTPSASHNTFYLKPVREKTTTSGIVREFILYAPATGQNGSEQLQETGYFHITEAIFTTASHGPRQTHLKLLPHMKKFSELRSESFELIRSMRFGESIQLKAKLKEPVHGKGLLQQKLVGNTDIRIEYIGCSERNYANQPFTTRSYMKEFEKTTQQKNGNTRTHFNKIRLDVDNKTGMILESTMYLRSGEIDGHSKLAAITPAK